MTGRTARNWGRLGLHVALLLVGLALLQVASERVNRHLDLTPGRSLSLSPLTVNVLHEVTGPCAITVFFRRGTRERYADLLGRFAATNPQLSVQLLDMDRFPDRARSLGVDSYGGAAIQYGGRHVVVAALPEAQLAGGILRAVRGTQRRVLFTSGHGERRPTSDPQGYGRFAGALADENYSADGISLLDGAIPDGTAMVVVGGPQRDFLAPEIDALRRFLRAGGGVLMLLDPEPLPQLSAFLGTLGITLGDDLIVDREKRVLGTDGLAAVVELFKRGNPISDAIDTGAVLPSARSVDVVREVPGVHGESIARTSPSAWAMADPARARAGEEPSEAAHDVRGAAPVVVMAEVHGEADARDRPPGRLVVVGDADFASDAYFDLLGNRDLALNAVAWVGTEPVMTGTRPADVPEVTRPLSPLVLTAGQARAIFTTGVVVQPALVLLLGLGVLVARRRWG